MTWRHLCLNSEGFLALKGTFVQTAALSLEKSQQAVRIVSTG